MTYREEYNSGRPTKAISKELDLKVGDILEILKRYDITYSEYAGNREMYVNMYKSEV